MKRRALVVTVSDSVSAGARVDASGPAVVELLQEAGWETSLRVVADERAAISSCLRTACKEYAIVLTTGGTGIADRDITPEATRDVIEREIPGFAEWMRMEGMRSTPLAVLSRAVAGTLGRSVVVNLPGSPKGAVQSLRSILHLLPHTVDLLHGHTEHTETGAGERASNG